METKLKKVGILSMQRIKNYGSFLQAYALKSLIEENTNSTVTFVDYHIEKPLISSKRKNKVLEVLKGSSSFRHKIQYINYKRNFNKYYSLLGITEEYIYNSKLDTLVIGSDEVFNCIQSNKNVGYSLELFGKDNKASNVITYAASFGNTTIEKLEQFSKKEEISSLLNKIDTISVRDANSLDIVRKLTNKKVFCHLDPVLIYDYMNIDNLIPKININEKYMIVYAYSDRMSKEEMRYIKDFAKEKKLKIYSIGGIQKYCDKFIDCSPFQVLAYFKNAEYIVTDTFHGSIFSIINKKLFVSLVRRSKDKGYGNEEKLTDLLERLGLEERKLTNLDNLTETIDRKINYKKVNEIIDEERDKTIAYLKSNI